MIKLTVFCVIVTVVNGFHMPGPTYRSRSSFDGPVNWSPYDVYFPGPTNHKHYYPHHNPWKNPPTVSEHMRRPPENIHSPKDPEHYTPQKHYTPQEYYTRAEHYTPPDIKTTEAPPKVNDLGSDDVCTSTVQPPDTDSQCCGVEASSSNYIVGGNTTKLEQYPWLVLIEYYNSTQRRFKKLCGGFLISGRYVLTAAHCLVGEIEQIGSPVNIILGDYNSTNEGPDCLPFNLGVRPCTDGAIKVPIETTLVHPKHYHDKSVSYNDIALVKLSRTVEYTNFIRPICLPKSDITVSPPADLRLYTAGWGAIKQRQVFQMGQQMFVGEYDNVKRHVDLPLKDILECKEKIGNFIGPGHLCAGGERGKDSCRGDSGGPLMYENDGIIETVGIVSAGSGKNPCGTEGVPALYTKVYNYIEWINESTKS